MLKLVISLALSTSLFGDVYQECLESARDEYSALSCTEKELIRQDKLLNIAYKKAMKRVESFRKDDLRNVQRLWIRYSDAKCNFYYHKHSGSAGLGEASECKLRETKQRIQELNEIE